ncbi:phosphonate C-P lyase system protein PhnH [Ciceribacter sp. L1K23]|uniref:phosphonate C-P lyase system protein PhnH n=1 Tax=Ciceribacter sp. L1K23 TaxID=2820276 RepID=UPI001B811384|nr:phosphonate C-P lyase system protein PhnH [Ciceribacter sp. L1K23]MBR0557580.1 phosphonate C-P lyase system protein PhnH [Ciceribacter sp. L1K23]
MIPKTDAFTGGFSEPVYQSQTVFRALMDGMARPGTLQTVATQVAPPPPVGVAAGAVALCLCDHDTTIWMSSALGKSVFGEWLGFHTGAPLTREKTEARFAFFELGAALPPFGLFSTGTQEYPDRSTTLIVEVAQLADGIPLTLRGPGIKDTHAIAPGPLPETFVRSWADNRAQFPRGVDVILTCGAQFVCLPRTCTITAREQ